MDIKQLLSNSMKKMKKKMQASLKAERQRLKSEHMKIMKTLDEEFRAADQVYKIITKL